LLVSQSRLRSPDNPLFQLLIPIRLQSPSPFLIIGDAITSCFRRSIFKMRPSRNSPPNCPPQAYFWYLIEF
jgi:hypothetical protein